MTRPDPKRSTTVEQFPLPRLPLSVLAWCVAVATRFRGRHNRSLAVVLLLDRSTRRWLPMLPTQSCGRARATWTLLDADYADLPGHVLVAGSFQSVTSGDLFDAQRAVPPYDGIHAVELLHRNPGRRHSWLFIRTGGGEAEFLVDPAAVVADDVEAALREAADRLRADEPSD